MLQLFLISEVSWLPLYCFGTSTLAGLFVWRAGKYGVARLHKLHQIPCDRCAFSGEIIALNAPVSKGLTE